MDSVARGEVGRWEVFSLEFSPKASHRVAVDVGIGCDECEAVVNGVCHEDSIERILVDPRQVAEEAHGIIVEVVTGRAKRRFPAGYEIGGRNSQGQLAQAVFDLDFQHGDLVENELVGRILNGFAGTGAQVSRFIKAPEEYAGVEEQSHFPALEDFEKIGPLWKDEAMSSSQLQKSLPMGHWPFS